MSFSRIFFYCCISFLFGVFVAPFFAPNFWFYFVLTILGLILFIVFYPYLRKRESKKKIFAILGICCFLFLFGAFWEEKFEKEIIHSKDKIHYYNDKGKVLVEGVVVGDLQEKEKSIETTVKVKKVGKEIVHGRLLVFLEPGSELKYGDKILLEGEVKEPKNFTPDFNYKEYLRARRIYSLMFYPEVKILERNKGNPILAKIFSFREKLKDRAKILQGEEGSILSAITIGDKSRLSDTLKDKLSISGLSHIVAISGMHIMIILEIFFSAFIFFGFWRREATIFSLIILFFYILLIGAPASAVRAGIMGVFLYLGWALGRLSQSSRSIVFAGTAMVTLNPLILTRDVGFQLSFLATLGIIYFYPIFEERFKAKNSQIKKLICFTLSAQILCLPILIFNFGSIPIFAPISNILVVPFLPALLISGFLFLIVAFFFPYFAVYLSFVLKLIFSWVIFVANFVSRVPFSSISFKINPLFIFVFYLILGVFLINFRKSLSYEAAS